MPKTFPFDFAAIAAEARTMKTRVIGVVMHHDGDNAYYSAIGLDAAYLAMHAEQGRYSSSSWTTWSEIDDQPVCSLDGIIWRESRKNLIDAGIVPNVVEIQPEEKPRAVQSCDEDKWIESSEKTLAEI